jgi:hypothetical protein
MAITSYDLRVQNRRFDALVKNLGADSPLVEQARTDFKALDDMAGGGVLKFLPNGSLHIINPSKLNQAGILKSNLPSLDIWGNLKKGHREGFKNSDMATMGDYINMQASIKQAVNVYGISDSQAPADLQAVSILRQSEKSWADIAEVNNLIGEFTDE